MKNKHIIQYSVLNSTSAFNIFGEDSLVFGNPLPNEILDSIVEHRQNDHYENEEEYRFLPDFNFTNDIFDMIFG